ncbi:MAG: glycoside hydrolase family 32 protein [Clostridiales bacterium]|nr:glycoside hydrolase family 32 protein [Clostridiales bacterium]
MERFKYHFEPKSGWMNDPNGLVFFGGKYHAFFQHNPHDTKWGPMHWGHAVSDDLICWEELPIALYPDMPYENSGGCFSGSAIEKDGKLYLFYTSVSKELGQTQSMAISEDGVNFTKYEGNPVIKNSPLGSNANFRDPKVFKRGEDYFMVTGAETDGIGRVLLFTSKDLVSWDFVAPHYETDEFGGTLECPDMFPLGDKWVLMFSAMKPKKYSTVFLIGDFDGKTFVHGNPEYVEAGLDFYAPQTLLSKEGRRIMIGWFYHWGKTLPMGADSAGALTLPRELSLSGDKLIAKPIAQACGLLETQNDHVNISGTEIRIINGDETIELIDTRENGIEKISKIDILFDKKAVEIFINGGEMNISRWLI